MQIITNSDTRPIPFLLVQSADHISGLTGATATVTISKNGAAFGSPSGAVAEIGSGWYKLTPSGSDTTTNGSLILHATASNADPTDEKCQVVAVDIYDATRFGLSALPNIASGSAGAIPTTGAGANQISVSSGQVILQSGTGTGQLDFTSGVVKANLAQILGTALTETAGQIAAAFKKFFDIASPTSTANRITLVDTTTTLTNAPSDSSGVTTLLSRLTTTRAGYLDNLSGGAVALAATALSTVQWTNSRAAAIDNLDVTVSSRMATFTQPTGFLAATFPTGTVASTTNITAGTLTTLTDLTTTANAEPTAVPTANASLADKIAWIAVLSRNKITETATTMLIRNNADSATIGTATTSDDGTTATRGGFV